MGESLQGEQVVVKIDGEQGVREEVNWKRLTTASVCLGLVGLFAVLNAFSSGSPGPLGSEIASEWQGRRILGANDTCDLSACDNAGYECTERPGDKAVGFIVLEWLIIVLLVALSAMFSGLTLGLMSLDKIGLEIVIGGDPDSQDAKYAKKIQPIRQHGNLLLCTLLLGNVMVNAGLSILLADYTSGIVGFISSSAVIVIFGEILPQAGCSRHALFVGAHVVWLVKIFLVLLWPLAKPLSFVLDHIFKEEIGSIYSSNQLNKLVEIHLKHHMVSEDQAKMMGGALAYKDKTVENVMTHVDKVFMLDMNEELDFQTMSKIFQKGFSRIPVCDGSDRNKIVGLLFTKDLILIDPEDHTSVKSVVQFFGRPVHYLWPDTKLSEALTLFRSGRTHLALVQKVNSSDPERDPFYEIAGLVTLEDIIEEILQEEILDETDTPESSNIDGHGQQHVGAERKSVDRAAFDFARLRLLDTRNANNTLSSDEVNAIVAHLSTNLPMFADALSRGDLTQEQIRRLVTSLPVLQLQAGEKLYIKGKPITHCTLVLSGKMDIVSGTEGFRSSLGPWSLVAQNALNLDESAGYSGDFTATVTSEEGLRCIRISRYNFEALIHEKGPHKHEMKAHAHSTPVSHEDHSTSTISSTASENVDQPEELHVSKSDTTSFTFPAER